MATVKEHHHNAFARVAAFVILDAQFEHVAAIAFKLPRDPSGRLYAYVHWLGADMARGFATGGGYDNKSAACQHAARKMALRPDTAPAHRTFIEALRLDSGRYWNQHLEDAGFRVLQAV